MGMSIVIELREDGLYYIGITNGIRQDIFFRAKSLKSAKQCAKWLREQVEIIRSDEAWPWKH